jgi:hypothetical protein
MPFLLAIYLAGFAFFLAAFAAMWSCEDQALENCGVFLVAAICALWLIALVLGFLAVID